MHSTSSQRDFGNLWCWPFVIHRKRLRTIGELYPDAGSNLILFLALDTYKLTHRWINKHFIPAYMSLMKYLNGTLHSPSVYVFNIILYSDKAAYIRIKWVYTIIHHNNMVNIWINPSFVSHTGRHIYSVHCCIPSIVIALGGSLWELIPAASRGINNQVDYGVSCINRTKKLAHSNDCNGASTWDIIW